MKFMIDFWRNTKTAYVYGIVRLDYYPVFPNVSYVSVGDSEFVRSVRVVVPND
jgi:hypothetical protein